MFPLVFFQAHQVAFKLFMLKLIVRVLVIVGPKANARRFHKPMYRISRWWAAKYDKHQIKRL